MSRKHPIIAVTGSSGAGTSTVKNALEQIFHRVGAQAAFVEGDSFHRYDRKEMKKELKKAKKEGRNLSHFGPEGNLFDKQKELLVIPVSITQYGVVPPTDETRENKTVFKSTVGGFWQGAYVFNITLSGFEFRGGITHQDNNRENYYGDYNKNVNRALYIGNILYTLSNTKVNLNNLTDLSQIATIQLN